MEKKLDYKKTRINTIEFFMKDFDKYDNFLKLYKGLEFKILNRDGFRDPDNMNVLLDVLYDLVKNGYIGFGNGKYYTEPQMYSLYTFHPKAKLIKMIRNYKYRNSLSEKINEQKFYMVNETRKISTKQWITWIISLISIIIATVSILFKQ